MGVAQMVSSASSQIEATGGNHLKTTIIKDGKPTVVQDYATVQGILLGVVAAFTLFMTIIGPECVLLSLFYPVHMLTRLVFRNHGAHFEKHKTAFEEGGGRDDALIEDDGRIAAETRSVSVDEKHSADGVDHKRLSDV